MRKRINHIAILLLALSFNSGQAMAHDLKMAFFEFSEEHEGIILSITFDKDDLALVLTKAHPELKGQTDLTIWEDHAKKYLKSHFKLKLNLQEIDIDPMGFTYDKDYVRIKVTLSNSTQKVESMEIWSDCLIDDIRGQSNIVKSTLHGRIRTFRLNKKRTAIKVRY